jgi:8-oxo-dGTP pyrophosphatase MutT (NUDIX family)
LLCQRPDEKRHGGLWEFPGGKLETGEDHFAAAQRELSEELSLEVTACGATLHSVADPQSPFIVDFVLTKVEGTPKLHEHQALLWVNADELSSLALAPSDKKFVQERKEVLKEIAERTCRKKYGE